MSHLESNVIEFTEIYRRIQQEGGISGSTFDKYEPQLKNLKRTIIEGLMWAPGSLIFIPDPMLMEDARNAMDELWDQVSAGELFEEITSGGMSGLLLDIIQEYSDRTAVLKPSLISIRPTSNEFQRYFAEAMRCWLFGLHGSAVILCSSVLENTLRDLLIAIDQALVMDMSRKKPKPFGLWKLVENARCQAILDQAEAEMAQTIAEIRNSIVHNLKVVPDTEQTYVVLSSTKNLIEKLMHLQANT